MKQLYIFAVFVSLLFLVSCQSAEPRVEYDGKLLSSEEIWALGESFRSESWESERETDFDTEKMLGTTDEELVYWTEGGTVWHAKDSCYRISKKSPVIAGSVDDAIAAKKERGCSVCCK